MFSSPRSGTDRTTSRPSPARPSWRALPAVWAAVRAGLSAVTAQPAQAASPSLITWSPATAMTIEQGAAAR